MVDECREEHARSEEVLCSRGEERSLDTQNDVVAQIILISLDWETARFLSRTKSVVSCEPNRC